MQGKATGEKRVVWSIDPVEKLREYFLRNFEQVFVLLVLTAIVLINYYVPHKLAFLNFYYLPVILAGYFLGVHRSVLGVILCILVVVIYSILYPEVFLIQTSKQSLYLHIVVWACFLTLAGAVVSKQHEKLSLEITETRRLNEQLQGNQKELNSAKLALEDYSKNLETKVVKRTEELEKSKLAIEPVKARVEDTLYSTMDSTVAKLIIEGRLRSETRRVSVLFSDLAGFTSYSEQRRPELVVRDLNRYLKDMEPTILAYRGHIDKYLGDGIMCEFGAPLDYDSYRLMAVLAAVKMQEKMAQLDYPWQMRVGIASGPAILGLIGNKRQTYTTIGDVVNLAARLEKICPPGSVLIDNYTLEGVERFFDVRLKKELSQSEAVESKSRQKLDTYTRS